MPRDFSTLASLLRAIPPAAWRGNIVAPDADLMPRFVASDRLEELDRRREAAILRDPRRFAFWDRGATGDTLVRDASGLYPSRGGAPDGHPFVQDYLHALRDSLGEAHNIDVPLEIEPFLNPGTRAAIAADAFHFLGSNADLDPRVWDLIEGDAYLASRQDRNGWYGTIAGRNAPLEREYAGPWPAARLGDLPPDVLDALHESAVAQGPYAIFPRISQNPPPDWWEFATDDGAPPGGPFLSGTYEVPDLPPLREGEDYSRYTQYEANMPSSDLPFVPDYVPQGRGGDHTPYGSADWGDLHTMLRAIGPRAWRGLVVEPDVDMTPRLVAADFMTELGRPREGAVLRDTRRFAYPKGAQGIPLGVMDATDLAAEYWGNAVAGRPVSRPDSISARNWVRHLLQEYDDRNPGFLEAYDDPWDALNLTSLAAMLADSATWGALAPWPGPAMPPGTIGDLRNGMNSDVINRRRGWPTADVLDDPDLRAFAAELGPYALEENESTHDLRGPYEVPMWPQLREGEDYARYDDLDYDCGLRPCLVPDAITALRTRLAGRNNRPAPPTPYDPVTEYAYTGSAAGDGDATSADNDYGLQQSLTVGGTMPLQPQFGSPSQANADPQAAVQQDTASLGITPEMIQQVLGGTARPMPTPHASLPYEGSDFPMGVPPMSYGTGDWASLDAILRAIPRAAWRGTESGADLSDVSEVPPLREGDYDGEEAPTDYATPNTIHQMIAARTRGEDVPDMALGDALMEIGHPLAPETVQRAAQRGVPLRDAALGHLSNPALTHAILGLQDSMHGVAFPRHHGRFGPRRGYGGPGDPGAFAPTHVGWRWIDPYQFLFTPEMAAFNPSGEVAESALALYPNTAHPFSRMLMTLRSMSPFFEDMTAPPDHEGVMPGLLSAVVRPWEALGLSQHMPQPHQDDIEQWFEENVPTAMNDLWHARAHHGRWRTDIPEWDERGIAARERGDEYDGEEAPAMYSTPETLHRMIQDRILRGNDGPPDAAFEDATLEMGHPLAAETWDRARMPGRRIPAHVLARLHMANPGLLHAILGLNSLMDRDVRTDPNHPYFGIFGYDTEGLGGEYGREIRGFQFGFPETLPFTFPGGDVPAGSYLTALPHMSRPLSELRVGMVSNLPFNESPESLWVTHGHPDPWARSPRSPTSRLPAVSATVRPREVPGLVRHLPPHAEDELASWAERNDMGFDWDEARGESRYARTDYGASPRDLLTMLQNANRGADVPDWAISDALQDIGHPLAAPTIERAAAAGVPLRRAAGAHIAAPAFTHALLGLRPRGLYGSSPRRRDVSGRYPSEVPGLGRFGPAFRNWEARPSLLPRYLPFDPELDPSLEQAGVFGYVPQEHYPDLHGIVDLGLDDPESANRWHQAAVVAPWEARGLAQHLPKEIRGAFEGWMDDELPQASDGLGLSRESALRGERPFEDWDAEARGDYACYAAQPPAFYPTYVYGEGEGQPTGYADATAYGLAEELQAALRAMPPRTWRGTLAGNPSDVDVSARGIGADMLQELGRLREALILRDPRRFAYLDFGGGVHDAADLMAPIDSDEQRAHGGYGWGFARPDNFTRNYLNALIEDMQMAHPDFDPAAPGIEAINRRTLAAVLADAHHFRAANEHLHPGVSHTGRGGLFERARNDTQHPWGGWFAGDAGGAHIPVDVRRALDEYAAGMGPYIIEPHSATAASGTYEVPPWTEVPPIPQDPDPANYAWHGVPVPVPEMPGRQPDRFKLLRAMLPPRPLGR